MSDIKYVLETFGAVGWGALVLAVVAGLMGARAVISSADALALRFGFETKGSREKKNALAMIQSHEQDRTLLFKEVEEGKRRDEEVNDKLSVIAQMMVELQARIDASERARIKDRISQGYRIYHTRGEWTEMEKEAFEGLIHDYEMHGGTNSFVHAICEPESCTWKIVKE